MTRSKIKAKYTTMTFARDRAIAFKVIDEIYNDFEAKENELKTWLENKINSNIDFKEKVAFQEVLDIIIDIEKEQKRI